MVLSDVYSGLKDELLVVGAVKAAEKLEEKYNELRHVEGDEISPEEDPGFEVVESGEDYTVFEPKPETGGKGGETMKDYGDADADLSSFEEAVAYAELAMDDHHDTQEYLRKAEEEVADQAEYAAAVAQAVAGDAEDAVDVLTDYLMEDRKVKDDRAVELMERKETVEQMLEPVGTSDETSDRIDRMRDRVDNEYFG
ncbi:MAG: hypothetical protein ABEJ75_04315 [Candidatus Nanohaloarchaea archaeon]